MWWLHWQARELEACNKVWWLDIVVHRVVVDKTCNEKLLQRYATAWQSHGVRCMEVDSMFIEQKKCKNLLFWQMLVYLTKIVWICRRLRKPSKFFQCRWLKWSSITRIVLQWTLFLSVIMQWRVQLSCIYFFPYKVSFYV